jgi:hypothetical protein
MTDKKSTFNERLKNHPDLQTRFERILDIVEAKVEGPDTADEVEERAIVEIQKLGQEVMEDWAKGKVLKTVTDHKESHPNSIIHKKKGSTGIPPMEKSK